MLSVTLDLITFLGQDVSLEVYYTSNELGVVRFEKVMLNMNDDEMDISPVLNDQDVVDFLFWEISKTLGE